jgi:hypothetical protein
VGHNDVQRYYHSHSTLYSTRSRQVQGIRLRRSDSFDPKLYEWEGYPTRGSVKTLPRRHDAYACWGLSGNNTVGQEQRRPRMESAQSIIKKEWELLHSKRSTRNRTTMVCLRPRFSVEFREWLDLDKNSRQDEYYPNTTTRFVSLLPAEGRSRSKPSDQAFCWGFLNGSMSRVDGWALQ